MVIVTERLCIRPTFLCDPCTLVIKLTKYGNCFLGHLMIMILMVNCHRMLFSRNLKFSCWRRFRYPEGRLFSTKIFKL